MMTGFRRFCVMRSISRRSKCTSPHVSPTTSEPRIPLQRSSRKMKRSGPAACFNFSSCEAENGCAPRSGISPPFCKVRNGKILLRNGPAGKPFAHSSHRNAKERCDFVNRKRGGRVRPGTLCFDLRHDCHSRSSGNPISEPLSERCFAPRICAWAFSTVRRA